MKDPAVEAYLLKARITDILNRYFELTDAGNPSPTFDPDYSASDALDDIHAAIGAI